MGISKKLLIAFGSVSAATFIACMIAFLAFQNLSKSLTTITDTSIPIIAKAIKLTQAGASLNAATPLLVNANTEEERAAARNSIDDIVADLITKIDTMQNELQSTSAIKPNVVTDMQASIEGLDQAVARKAKSNAELSAIVVLIDELKTDINARLVKTIDREAKKFIGTTNLIFKRNTTMLDSLLSEDVKTTLAALRLQNAITEAHSTLSYTTGRFSDAERLVYINDAVDSFQIALDMWADFPVSLVKKPEALQSKMDEFVRTALALQDGISNPDISESSIKTQFVNASADIAVLRDSLIEELDKVADSRFSRLQGKGNNLKRSATEILPEKISQAMGRLTGLLELRAELNVVSGIVAQSLYVDNTSRIEQLNEQLVTSIDVVNQLMAESKKIQGMAGVVKRIDQFIQYGNSEGGVLEVRAEVLQHIVEIDSFVERLENDKSEIDVFLVEQAQSAQDEVSKSSKTVHAMIEKSHLQLLIVGAATLVFTIMIYWFLVSRNILRRLLITINALKSLSKGDYNVSVVDQRSDELGELARTLEVFRENAEKSARMHEEQEVLKEAQLEQIKKQKELEDIAQFEKAKRHEDEMKASEEHRKESMALQERVDELLAALSAIAEGDLDYPVNTSGDDVAGQMGRSLKRLVMEMRHSMGDININAAQLTISSSDLTGLSDSLMNIADSNVENTSRAAQFTEEVSDGITSVASAAEEMSSSIQDILGYTNEAESVAKQAVYLAQSTDSTVKDLAKSSSGIGSVVKVITSIAEQTNLLALNATIEAARAGDAGKGFAVVANEVKELAKETAKATQQIESRIHDIQSSTDTAVNAIENISGIIKKISGIQETITVAVDEQATVTKSIAKSVVQTSDGSYEIKRLLALVTDRATENHEAAGMLAEAAGSLAETAASQQQLVQRFKMDEDPKMAA